MASSATTKPSSSTTKKASTTGKVPSSVTKPRPEKKTAVSALKKLAKIEKLPKTVQDSIPLRGFMQDGTIETTPGVFTRTYKLKDVNFSIASEEDQMAIFKSFIDFLNSFNEFTKWEFTIFNHEIDKRKTIEDIQIKPQQDGLNKYRKELNKIMLDSLKTGNNSITQDKYLTVSVEDLNAEHAAVTLKKLDGEINRGLKKITKVDTLPMSSYERMNLLYSIYNQDFDYRLITGLDKDEKEVFDLDWLTKSGLSVKDVIGPNSMDFTNGNRFMLGDIYGQALYLERVPPYLTSQFVADLSDMQSNMLISVTMEGINAEKSIKLVRNQLGNIESRVAAVEKRNGEGGYFGALPPELERAQKNARSLMDDIMGRNQKLFLTTFTVVVFARTLEQLDENVRLVKSIGAKHICPLKPMKFQQEFAFNTALPLCRNDVFVERLYTSESAAVFIPFNSEELVQKNAIFYGINQSTKSMILYDRLTGNNYNGLIFGYSGSGKSFIAKCEMISVLLGHPNSQVFVVDPQGEYAPLTKAFHGQEIVLSPGSTVYINPLDLDISPDESGSENPVTTKLDFVITLFTIIMGKNQPLTPVHTAILDKCVKRIYRPYIEMLEKKNITTDISICPTLSDLYQELLMQKDERDEAGQLADILYQYAVGSFTTFAHRTNVNTDARFVVYNTKMLGTGMKELGLFVSVNDIWNRMIRNSKKNIYTWFYIDEFHILLESEGTTAFLKRIWKMARKWLGVPTGIMQNTEDLLRNADTRAIVNNTSLVIMLKESQMDRQNLATLFNLSSSQLEYITNSDPGHGLIYNGKVILPFKNDFPKNTKLYAIMTTAHDVAGAEFT